MYKKGVQQYIPFITTVVGILLTDLLIGICIGLATAIFFILRHNYRIQCFQLDQTQNDEHKITIILSDYVSYLNKAILEKTLNTVPENYHLIVDGRNTKVIDPDVLDIFEEYSQKAIAKNIQFELLINENPLSDPNISKLQNVKEKHL